MFKVDSLSRTHGGQAAGVPGGAKARFMQSLERKFVAMGLIQARCGWKRQEAVAKEVGQHARPNEPDSLPRLLNQALASASRNPHK